MHICVGIDPGSDHFSMCILVHDGAHYTILHWSTVSFGTCTLGRIRKNMIAHLHSMLTSYVDGENDTCTVVIEQQTRTSRPNSMMEAALCAYFHTRALTYRGGPIIVCKIMPVVNMHCIRITETGTLHLIPAQEADVPEVRRKRKEVIVALIARCCTLGILTGQTAPFTGALKQDDYADSCSLALVGLLTKKRRPRKLAHPPKNMQCAGTPPCTP